MDGTLIDTEPLWGKATFELGELLGRPLTPEVRARTIGGSFPNTLSVVAEWAGYELKDGDLERYRTWMFTCFTAKSPHVRVIQITIRKKGRNIFEVGAVGRFILKAF